MDKTEEFESMNPYDINISLGHDIPMLILPDAIERGGNLEIGEEIIVSYLFDGGGNVKIKRTKMYIVIRKFRRKIITISEFQKTK